MRGGRRRSWRRRIWRSWLICGVEGTRRVIGFATLVMSMLLSMGIIGREGVGFGGEDGGGGVETAQ